ncbi:MAG TPA: hypothetical protein VFF28_02030 [Candidatus Nanoarchaeia archaeon]|nr:hypothetical protein [Candidatus Nanoarchaeia archaeon]
MEKEKIYEDDEEESGLYEEYGKEDLGSDDEVSPEEEGFMQGYDEVDEEPSDEDIS